MKKMKNAVLILLSILVAIICSMGDLVSQESELPDFKQAIVELKSGTKVEGEIVDWQMNEYITLKFFWGAEHTFKQSEIRRVIQKSALNTRIKNEYVFKDKGLYIAPSLYAISGNNGNRAESVWGLGGSVSAGHRFNRWISVGAGIGYDRYIWRSGEDFMPFFAELSGFLNESNRSLFYNLKLGYSIAFENEQYLLTEARGGIMVHPNIGYSWGADQHKMGISIGYKFQDARLVYQNAWDFGRRSEQDILYKRLTFALSYWY